MTGFKLERFPFAADDVKLWGRSDERHRNWPVVYVINNDREVYVGESVNAESRMRQHLDSEEKQRLKWVRVVLDKTFNKSACLDLESFLIRMFSGDGSLQVLNHNAGITDADYYDRDSYRKTFDGLFADLEHGRSSTAIVQGNPGTGKTVVAIYLLKLLEDVRRHDPSEPIDGDSL